MGISMLLAWQRLSSGFVRTVQKADARLRPPRTRNLIFACIAGLIGCLVAVANAYSECRELELELALREQGIEPEQSWRGRTFDLFLGNTRRSYGKLACDLPLTAMDYVTSGLEITVVWGVTALARTGARAAYQGLARSGLIRTAAAAQRTRAFVMGAVSTVQSLGLRGTALLAVAGLSLAVYLGAPTIFMDGLAMLPMPVQALVLALLLHVSLQVIYWFLRLSMTVVMWIARARLPAS